MTHHEANSAKSAEVRGEGRKPLFDARPRLRWMPVRFVVLLPLALVAWIGKQADRAFWAIEERIK